MHVHDVLSLNWYNEAAIAVIIYIINKIRLPRNVNLKDVQAID